MWEIRETYQNALDGLKPDYGGSYEMQLAEKGRGFSPICPLKG